MQAANHNDERTVYVDRRRNRQSSITISTLRFEKLSTALVIRHPIHEKMSKCYYYVLGWILIPSHKEEKQNP